MFIVDSWEVLNQNTDMRTTKILVPQIGLFPLDYVSKQEYKIGDLVVVPLRNKKVTGIVWELNSDGANKRLKTIDEEAPFPSRINSNLIKLIKQASKYYLADLGTIAKLVLPVDPNDTPIKIREQKIPARITLPELSDEQEKVLKKIETYKKPILLKGVTGSGKTEVYFYLIKKAIEDGKQALIMLPEIALSKQIISRFTERFGFEPVVWNSQVTKVQKKRILRGLFSGDVKVVIGARSALFLPYSKLGCIIVDEEHDPSYKQNEGILYHARDMAVLRGSIEDAKTVLVSATPSIETIHNVNIGKYDYAELKGRFKDAMMPDIEIISMKEQDLDKNTWLSSDVNRAIRTNLEQKNQTLIFLNRRGYAPLMLCRACGYRFDCNSCSASLVMHKNAGKLECHHCGHVKKVPDSCPECKEADTLILCGPGIERIEEEVKRKFPEAKIVVLSKEQTNSPEEMQKLLDSMKDGEIDILIGTQIITKGYHFPNLTLVVVVDADAGFAGGDLRASERTFQLLHQVGGRAGRADKKGKVLMQTYNPENRVIQALAAGRETDFIKEELETRGQASMPPFARLAAITITGKNAVKTLIEAQKFAAMAPKSSARVLGPSEAGMLKLAGKYRYKILVIAEKDFALQKYLSMWKDHVKVPASIQLKVDIDPHNFV